jgi:hypothetical protein
MRGTLFTIRTRVEPKINKMMKLRHLKIILIALVIALASACTKTPTFDNPYAGGKQALGVQISLTVPPTPTSAAVGTTVTFSATGLLPYKDKLIFMFNGEVAQVVSVTDAAIAVIIPPTASTGVTTISIGDQVFFGPRFKVLGKISVDPAFSVLNGANNTVNTAYQLSDGRLMFVGAFTDYDTKALLNPINHIALAFNTGSADISFKSNGSDGPLTSILSNGSKLFVSGGFHSFYFLGGKATLTNMNNITRLGLDGTPDSILVPVYNSTKKKAVPAFVGNFNGSVTKIFNFNGKITAIGSFTYYGMSRYDSLMAVKPRVIYDTLHIPQVARLDYNGLLDPTFRYNQTKNTGFPGGNGSVYDGFMQADGKLVIVGNFTKFDSTAISRIVRLNADGTIDQTFNTGSGADKAIYSISYNAISNKYFITGAFTTYNGQPASGIAMLNVNGSLDNTFASKGFNSEGTPTFAKQLSNGLVIVSGSFVNYNNIRHNGFIVLDQTGNLALGYNTLGDFVGSIHDVLETTNSSGKITALLMGTFTQIDGLPVNNITRVVFEP